MSLTKTENVDRIEVIENGFVQVRVKTAILENGVQISATYSRYVIEPGQDYSGQPQRVKSVCDVIHTPEVIEAHKAAQTV
jgi:hypothetical protein